MIDHNVVRLDITVHDTLAVTKVQGLQQLEDVVADIVICEAGVQSPEIRVVDSLENQAGSLALIVTHYIQQCNNIRATRQILENLNLSLDLLLLDRLQNLDDTFLIVDHVDAFEYLGILSSA